MGKLLHKLVHGIMPSWLFTRFRRSDSSRKKLQHFRLRHGIHFKSSAPTLPSLSAPSNTELVDLLIDMDQSTYYYSQSEGEEERPITGHSNRMSSPSIESKSHDDDDDHDDQIHSSSHNPKMGICALAATSIIKGRWHEDKHEQSPTSPASIHPQSQHDNDDHQHYHHQEGCLDHSCPLEHQTRELTRSSTETGFMKKDEDDNGHSGHGCHQQHQHQALHDENHEQHHAAGGQAHGNQHLQHHADNGPDTNQHPQHHAGNGSLFQHNAHHYHHNNHHVSEYQHHAGDGSLCQHDDDDVYHHAHHYRDNNHVHEYLHHTGDGSLCMHDGSEYHHHASDRSLYQHDDDVYHHKNHHVYKYRHHGQTYGRNNLLHISKHGRRKPTMGSRPISSLAKTIKTRTQCNYGHHHSHHRDLCQSDNQPYQHYASNIDYHRPHFGGFKRKSICLDEDDGKEDGKDENNYHCISPWPRVKRQKTHKGGNVGCELPECISEKVGDGCAVVQYSYQNPQFAFSESMVQMIVGNELWGRSELEFLLHCYLALNDPHLHQTICTSFLQVLKDLQQSFLLWAPVDKANTI